ncbi:MAG: hypothetical protein WCC77_02660 [Pseudolabrys sp.]
MSRFVVHFMKDVLGENGREQEIRQCTVEVDAASKTEATQLAKQKFCETQGLSDWSDHADRMQVKKAISRREIRHRCCRHMSIAGKVI